MVSVTSGHYVASTLYIYLGLYRSLKKRLVNKPAFSKKTTVILSTCSLLLWSSMGAVSYAFPNPDYSWSPGNCDFGYGRHTPSFMITSMSIFAMCLILLLVCHCLIIVFLKSTRAQLLSAHRSQPDGPIGSVKERKWLSKKSPPSK